MPFPRFGSIFRLCKSLAGFSLARRRKPRPQASPPGVEELERRVTPSVTPTVSLTAPATNFIGEDVPLSVSFSNMGTAPGYAPYVDVIMPATGIDGNGVNPNDGITFVNGSATYLGASVTTTVWTFNSSGQAIQPDATNSSGGPLIINGPAGDQLVVFQLPFGSFTPGQPTATIDFNGLVSDLARVGDPLSLQSFGVFALGDTAVGDTSIVGSTITSSVTPTVVTLTKTYLGPEQETATGPNFPEKFELNVAVANGQTITDVNLSDAIPSNMQFVQVDSATGNGSTTITTTSSPTSSPGGTLTLNFDKLVGTGNDTDAVIIFTFYIPEFDASGNPVLDPTTGAFVPSMNNASLNAAFTPLNPLDPTNSVSATATNTITDKSIAIQKTVADVDDVGAVGPTPNDTLQYTLNFQISDFFAFSNVIATDIMSDGQAFNTSFTPTITYTQDGITYTSDISSLYFSDVRDTTVTGETTVTFNVAQELALLGLTTGGDLLGAGVPVGGGTVSAIPSVSGTVGTITFQSIISNYYLLQPSPNAPVVEGDQLTDNVTIGGHVLSTANLSDSGYTESDGSSATVNITRGTLTKAIYAVDGSTTLPTTLQVGDAVTYELTYTLPSSDIVNYVITDYLPLPIFPVSEMTTTFDSTPGATAPAAGTSGFGADDTFYAVSGITPTVTLDSTANSISFDFGTYKDPNNDALTTDILFTVVVGHEPFADGLFLTNEAHETEGSETGGTAQASTINQIRLDEPSLQITKGVVATDDPNGVFSAAVGPVSFSAPGSSGFRGSGDITSAGLTTTPISADLSDVQASDLVTFAVVVQNTGSGVYGAFNVTVQDTIPTGFEIPTGGLNLSVTGGDGAPLAYTEPNGSPATDTDLFGVGIELTDPSSSQGALTTYSATSGTNILVITYDLQADGPADASPVQPLETLTNTAEITNYASTEGGTNFLSSPATASSTVTIAPIQSTKTLASTELGLSNNDVVIGELVSYQLVETIPQGDTMDAEIVDTLPTGLAFVDSQPLIVSSGLDILGSETPVVTNSGTTIAIDLSEIENTNTDSSVADTITFDYRAIVLNISSNKQGVSLTNKAAFDYTDGTGTAQSIASQSAAVNVIEPVVGVNKGVSVNGVANGAGQAGDTVSYTITLENSSPAEAYDVTLNDPLPQVPSSTASLILSPTFTVSDPNGGGSALNASDFQLTGSDATGYTLAALGSFTMPVDSSRVITITITGTLSSTLSLGETISNTAGSTWQDLPGSPSATSPYDVADSTTRSSSGSSTTTFQIATPTIAKSILSTTVPSLPGPNVAVGEDVTYQLVATLPAATYSAGLILTDTLPTGLGYVSSSIASIGSEITGVAGGSAIVSGQMITFNFGTHVVDKINNAAASANEITVDVTALVQNVAGNVSGTMLTNNVSLNYGSGTATASNAVQVVEPKLQIAKTSSTTQADDGNVVTYSVTVSHTAASTGPAFNVVVSDAIVAGLSLVVGSVTTSAGTVTSGNTAGNTTVSVSDPLLALGSTIVIACKATLTTTNAPGSSVTNTANLAYNHGPSTRPDSGSSQATVTINTNTLSGYVYIDANNDGVFENTETPLNGVKVTLTGKTYLGTTVSVSTTTNASGQYSFTGLQPGTYTVSETQPAGYMRGIDSPGTNFGGTGSAVTASPQISSITIPLESNTSGLNYNFAERIAADIAVSKVVSNAMPNVNSVISYTIQTTNNGPSNATNVVVNDLLPSGLTFQSATVAGGTTYSSGTGNWSIPALNDGTSVDLVIFAKVVSPNATTNTATVTASDQMDPNLANNTASAVETPQQSKVTLTKTVSNTSPNVGNVIVYTLTVSNTGPNTATTVVVTDPLPTGESYACSIPPGGTTVGFSFANETLTWYVGSLAVNTARSMPVSVVITGANAQTNTATVSEDQYNPNPANQTATSSTVTPQQADLALAKTVSNATPNYGDLITYTLTLTNNGPNTATNVYVLDALPSALVYSSYVASNGGSFNWGNDLWYVPSLPDLASATLKLTVQVRTASPVVNSASIYRSDQYDPNTANNTASVGITPKPVSSLSGYVYAPNNNNVGLGGVTVTLTGVNSEGNAVSMTTTTAANGSYMFADLLAGTYTISRTAASGMTNNIAYYGTQGGPSLTSTSKLAGIAPGSDVNGSDNNFTETIVASKYLLLASTAI